MNATRTWIIFEDVDTGWSIKTFFSDLTTYIDSDMFGLDNFGLAILTFFIIFITTGIMSYKFGISDIKTISVLLFTLVLFFDVGLGLMDGLNPINAVPHFPTIFVGIILLGILIREGLR